MSENLWFPRCGCLLLFPLITVTQDYELLLAEDAGQRLCLSREEGRSVSLRL